MLDLVIRNGKILDGLGTSPVVADIIVQNENIAHVEKHFQGLGRKEIDASDLVVAPGFIDIHSHSDLTLFFQPDAESKIRQGITTEVVGNCGVSAAPVRADHYEELICIFETNNSPLTESQKAVWKWPSQVNYMRELVQKGVSSNLITLVGGVPLRVGTVGMKTQLSFADVESVKGLLRDELGHPEIWGMSSGIQYVPECYYTTDELIKLCKVIRKAGKLWSVHIREEKPKTLDAVGEILSIAEQSEVSVQISHLKVSGKQNWGQAPELLKALHEARDKGIDITWDQYPYTAYCSGLIDVVPPFLWDGKIESFLNNLGKTGFRETLKGYMLHGVASWYSPLKDIDWQEMSIAEVKYDKELVGKTVREIADQEGIDALDVILDLLRSQETSVKVIVPAMSEEDVVTIMKDPITMISSDGKAVSPWGRYAEMHPHPRYYGAFPRVLGRYVRENKVLNLPEAVRKMTSLPASKLGLRDRGVLKPGNAADIVIFDPERISDKATFNNPHQFACGIEYVIVNGKVVIGEGEHTGTYPGKLLTHDS